MSRRTALLLLALVVFAAGCTSDVPDAQVPAAVDSGAYTLLAAGDSLAHVNGTLVAFDPAQERLSVALRSMGRGAFEPTIGATSDGTLFVSAANFLDAGAGPMPFRQPGVLRSLDAGATWEDVTPALPPWTGDPYVYVDRATDRVFSLDMFPDLLCGTLSFSDDAGGSWTTVPMTCGAPPYDHQTLVAAPPATLPTVGYENVVHMCANRVAASVCARSVDGGVTWALGAPPFLALDAEDVYCTGTHGRLAASADGAVLLPRTFCGAPMLAVSRDDATTWTAVRVSEETAIEGPDPAVAADAGGNLHYVFIREDGRVMLTSSTDGGATWRPAVDVTFPPVDAAGLPTIVAGDAGRVAISYVGTEELEDGYLNPDAATAQVPWHGYVALIPDALAEAPVVVTSRVNPVEDPLVLGMCGPLDCPGMADFIDATIGPDGRVYATFVDACPDACTAPADAFSPTEGLVAAQTGGPLLVEG